MLYGAPISYAPYPLPSVKLELEKIQGEYIMNFMGSALWGEAFLQGCAQLSGEASLYLWN